MLAITAKELEVYHGPTSSRPRLPSVPATTTKISEAKAPALRLLHLFSGPLRDADLGNALKAAAASQGWECGRNKFRHVHSVRGAGQHTG